jgi:hypothetical protein
LIFPYLPVSKRLRVGPWTLIPVADLQDDEATSPTAAEQARGINALYRPSANRRGFGAFVRADEPVGDVLLDPFDRAMKQFGIGS